jgi:hypothetical protein
MRILGKLRRLTLVAAVATGLSACGGGSSGGSDLGASKTDMAVAPMSGASAPYDSATAPARAASAPALNLLPDTTPAVAKSAAAEKAFVGRAPIYRFYNTRTGTHFYTVSAAERDNVLANYSQYVYDGIGFYADSAPSNNTKPVYRFYNTKTGAHFFTVSTTERDQVQSTYAQFTYEGIAWYVNAYAGGTGSPMYRFYNVETQTHFYTISATERETVLATYPQYRDEGIGYYAWTSEFDARSGDFTLFSSSGARAKLTLDFVAMRYVLADADSGTGNNDAGTFTALAAEPDTFQFNSSRISAAVNTARFRLAQDTVVGNFPFQERFQNSASFSVRPFVASKKLVETQAALDGTYNLFAVGTSANGGTSAAKQGRIMNGGTRMERCMDWAVARIENCPASARLDFDVQPVPGIPGQWRLSKPNDATDYGRFSVAADGENKIYLSAGGLQGPLAPGGFFRIGLLDAAWPQTFKARGGTTDGWWGALNSSQGNPVGSFVAPDTINHTRSWYVKSLMITPGIPELWLASSLPTQSGGPHFAARGGRVVVMIQYPNNAFDHHMGIFLTD